MIRFKGKITIIQLMVLSAFLAFGTNATSSAWAISQEEAAKKLEALTWYTEEYPPYNYEGADGHPTGMTVDILMAAFDKIGVGIARSDIKIAAWNRSYKYVQTKPGTALFSMSYTPEREKIVKFVGPAVPLPISIVAPKSSKIVISKPKDMHHLTIGVVRNDIGDQLVSKLLADKGKIRRITSAEQLFKLLTAGKIDVVAYSVDVFKNVAKKSGGDPSKYEGLYVLREGQAGYAFHNSTDPAVLEHLQKAIDELRADGTIDKIINGYNQ